jgi:hypothetical protein
MTTKTLTAGGYVLVWALCGLCRHQLAADSKDILSDNVSSQVPVILTVLDVVTCLVILKLNRGASHRDIYFEGIGISLFAHAKAVFAANFWFYYLESSDSRVTSCIDLLLTMILVRLCTGASMTSRTCYCLLVLTLASIGLSWNRLYVLISKDPHIIVTFLWTYFVALRNIDMKLLLNNKITVTLRSRVAAVYALVPVTLLLFTVLYGKFLPLWTLMLALTSCLLSALLIFLSTCILSQRHVTHLAILNLCGQVLYETLSWTSLQPATVALTSIFAISAAFAYCMIGNENGKLQGKKQ